MTNIRIGQGFDVHAFGDGDHVMLGGVRVPHECGVLAHSDGDVALHALCDAILGALALGDIGQHFPPSDPQWKGAASIKFLQHAVKLANDRGYHIANADIASGYVGTKDAAAMLGVSVSTIQKMAVAYGTELGIERV